MGYLVIWSILIIVMVLGVEFAFWALDTISGFFKK